mgnify:CR=1 FL=1
MEFFIKGRIPSKKNSVNIFTTRGRVVKTPNNRYKAWHKDCSKQITELQFSKPVKVSCIDMLFFAPDRRKTDLTNKAESVMDLLVDNGILVDDNWYEVGHIILRFGGVNKETPGVNVKLFF